MTQSVSGGQTGVGSDYTATFELTGDKRDNYELPSTNTANFEIYAATPVIAEEDDYPSPSGDDNGLSGDESGTTLVYNGNYRDFLTDAGTAPSGTRFEYKIGSNGTWSTSIPQGRNVGDYEIYWRLAATSPNYTNLEDDDQHFKVSITPAPLTIKAKNETITYGDAAPAPYIIEDIAFLGTDTKDINDFEGSLSVTCSYAKYNNAGSYDIVPSGYTSKNYTITFEKGTLTVNKIQAQIAWRGKNDSETDFSYQYDGEEHCPTAVVTNLVSGTECTVTVTGGQTNAGNYTATYSTLSNDNYIAPTANLTQNFTITPIAVTISNVVITEREYNATTGATVEEAQLNGVLDADKSAVTLHCPTATFADKNVGIWNVTFSTDFTLTGTKSQNYVISAQPTDVTGKIKKKTLTVTAKDNTITYGDEPAANDVIIKGFVNAPVVEDRTKLGGTLSFTFSYTQYQPCGEYTITPDGWTSDNYEFDYQPGKLTVNQREVGLTWSPNPATYTYDGESHRPSVTEVTNLVNNDDCSVSKYSDAKTNAGSYTAEAQELSNSNYKLPENNKQAFVINKAAPTITKYPVAKTLPYNGGEQEIITAGEVTNGTLKYRVGESGEFLTEIPKRKDAGGYTVYYMVEGSNDNYADIT